MLKMSLAKRASGHMLLVAATLMLCATLGVVLAASGDNPITQLAYNDANWEYGTSVTASKYFSGAFVDVDGVMYATTNDAIFRVPLTVTRNVTFDVRSSSIPLTNPPQYAPCISKPGEPANPPCSVGNAYAGDSQTLLYPLTTGETTFPSGLSFPFIANGKLYAVASRFPTTTDPGLVVFDPRTFSRFDANYSPIRSAKLSGVVKIFVDSTNAIVYAIANSDGGNANIVKIPFSTIQDQDTWQVRTFTTTSIHDIAWNGAKTAFVAVGTYGGAETNGVWTVDLPAADWDTLTPGPPDSPATLHASCNNRGVTIAYDVDAVVGDRILVGCSANAILTLSPTFSHINSTALDGDRDQFNNWVHDESSGIIYAALSGTPGVDGFTNVLQFSSITGLREGRIETRIRMSANQIVLVPSPAVVPDSQVRARAPFFYVVGGNDLSQLSAIARWQGAQGCLDNCGQFASPVRGTCTRRTCSCGTYNGPPANVLLQYLEPWCATLTCPGDCNGNGVCANSTCSCFRDWTTAAPASPCLQRRCPNDCLASLKHGTCQGPSTNYTCKCDAGWQGDDCSQKAKFPCNLLTANCTACVDNPACVWCASSRTCVIGTVEGPAAPLSQFECRSWFHASCPSIGINIVNYIITAVLGIVLLISLISGALNDSSEEVPERRTEWYLFQRANKLWSMVYQLQLIALAGLINIPFATNFVAFTRYWNWILLAWGFPWHHSKESQDGWADSVNQSGRTTKNWEQYMTYWKSSDNHQFFAFLLWWVVALGVFIVFYIILLIISVIRKGRTGFIATTRPVFILLRALEFGHLGVCVMGPLALVASKGASAIVGGILWVVLGILAPIGLFIWLGFLKEKKDLFKPTFAASCYPYYGAYDFRYRAFIVAPWAKRILLGLFIGFIAKSNPLGQLIAIAIIHLLYLIFVIIQRNMFSDYLQRYLEIILAIANLISFLFLFGFYNASSGNVSSAMGIIFLVIQFLAVTVSAAFFIISWLQLNQVYSLSQCIKFCTCRGGDK